MPSHKNSNDDEIGICNSILIDEEKYGKQMTFPGVWQAESILTVSSETPNHEFSLSSRGSLQVNKREQALVGNILLSILLILSIAVFTTSYVLLNIYDNETFNHNVLHTLYILRHMALYSFGGYLASSLAIYLVFSTNICMIRKNKWENCKDLIKAFVTSHIFNAKYLNDYLNRAKSVNDNETGQIFVRFVESNKFDELLHGIIENLLTSTEGVLLQSMGVEEQSLKSHAKSILLDVLVLFFQQVPLSYTRNATYNPQFFKHHIERLVNEQLTYTHTSTTNLFIKKLVWQHFNDLVSLVWFIMALFGACVGSAQLILK